LPVPKMNGSFPRHSAPKAYMSNFPHSFRSCAGH
jgi:hypothetical protein